MDTTSLHNDSVSEPVPLEDGGIDSALRPNLWNEYIGQDKIKDNLRIIIDAARFRAEAMDHLLFCGPAGLGKTTLAYLAAKELGSQIKVTSGPALSKAGDLAAVLTNLEPRDVLFIDEIHRINHLIEEVLYPAMESRKLHLMVGKGPSARSLVIDLPPFTLIAATTRENLLSQPLRSRFGATFRLNFYDNSDIKQIIRRGAAILNIAIEDGGVEILADASRATPRIANRLLKRARDCAQVSNSRTVSRDIACKTLELLEIDSRGLEPHDRRLLSVIIDKFHGGPVGIATLAASMNEEKGVIEDIYEPYLMSIGFLQRTGSGRIALEGAYEHLKEKKKQLF